MIAAAVELPQQLLRIGGDEVDDLLRLRLVRRQARRFGHRLLGPFDVAAAQLREAADVGGRILHRLALVRVGARRFLSSPSSGVAGGVKPMDTGDAAPTLVPGAIAATWLAYRMNVPALAARAPEGATYVTTGTGDARMSCTIRRIDVSRPPGVSSVSTTSCASSLGRAGEAALDVFGARGADDAGDVQRDDGRGLAAAGVPAERQHENRQQSKDAHGRRFVRTTLGRGNAPSTRAVRNRAVIMPSVSCAYARDLRGGSAARRSSGRAPNSGFATALASASSSAVASAVSSCRSRAGRARPAARCRPRCRDRCRSSRRAKPTSLNQNENSGCVVSLPSTSLCRGPDADDAAPRARADQRADPHQLEAVREDVAVGARVLVGQRDDRPGRRLVRVRLPAGPSA